MNYEELLEWNYICLLKENLKKLGEYVVYMNMRIDFYLDYFVVLNLFEESVFK